MYMTNTVKAEEEGMLQNAKGTKPSAENEERRPTKITICYFMGAAYASTIGGTGTVVGSGTNLAFKGIYESIFSRSKLEINFTSWMIFNVPGMLINMLVTWAYLQIVFMGMWRPGSQAAKEAHLGKEATAVAASVIQRKYNELGPITSHEISVAFFFMLSVFLFFFRKPGFIPGWADLFPKVKIGDATPAIFVVILLFVFPAVWTCFRFCKAKPGLLCKQNILLYFFF